MGSSETARSCRALICSSIGFKGTFGRSLKLSNLALLPRSASLTSGFQGQFPGLFLSLSGSGTILTLFIFGNGMVALTVA